MVSADYNRELDILMVEEDSYEDFERNIELGGFVLDLDSQQNFLGLEIIDASQKISLDKNELSNIGDVEVNFEQDQDVVRVELILHINDTKNVISSQYPAAAIA